MSDVTDDTLLDGRVRLLQPARGHRAGTDAVLLAAAAHPRPGETVADIGAATGAVGLMIASRRPGARYVFVERDPRLAALLRLNLERHGVDGRVAEADLLVARSRRAAGLEAGSVDWVVTNPPYLEEGRSRVSPDADRASAHVLGPGGLESWLRACSGLLKPKGRLVLIHRADRLAACLSGLGRSFGGVRLRLVHPAADRPAIRLLLSAVKGSRAPLAVEAPLVLHEAAGGFTALAQALHQGEACLA
jgi:tRNA1(Val) A37 N6-methylase TrmN6